VTFDLIPACPSRPRRSSRAVGTLALLVVALLAARAAQVDGVANAAETPRPLRTAIVDPAVFTSPDAAAALRRAAAAGISVIKVPLFWNEVAPASRPGGFRPANPGDPSYSWSGLDSELELIRAQGLEPLVYIAGAPKWAYRRIDGAERPDPAQVADFALAAVKRYSGTSPDLPRVRLWQAWNEPNKVPSPAAKPGAADWYRALVNRFAAAVHTRPGDTVIAGGLSPFGISTAVAPLTFMRELLCLPEAAEARPPCSTPVHFDVWSTDPYTAGGPTHVAPANDVSIAELPQVDAALKTAARLGHLVSSQPVRFWVTEFSWDSDPPDPGGVPAALEGRWVSEALYRMWSSGVSLVTWFTLRDQPFASSPYQSGLYYLGKSFATDRPKPALTAFRFPFVAFPDAGQVDVWGRTPTSTAGPVAVEQEQASTWRRVATLHAAGDGIFQARVRAIGKGPLRARILPTGSASLPFSLVSPPDRTYQPFGAVLAPLNGRSASNAAVSQYVEQVPTAAGGSAVGPRRSTSAAGAPGSTLAAAGLAVGSASRWRTIVFVGCLAGIALVLVGPAMSRRRRARASTGSQLRRP
jgi:hypothetical protein